MVNGTWPQIYPAEGTGAVCMRLLGYSTAGDRADGSTAGVRRVCPTRLVIGSALSPPNQSTLVTVRLRCLCDIPVAAGQYSSGLRLLVIASADMSSLIVV